MRTSAGILPYRFKDNNLQVYLVYPGGPQYKKNQWGIAKGGVEEDEDKIDAAKREFKEETSFDPPAELFPIGMIQQRTNKIVYAWAGEQSDFGHPISNEIEIEVNGRLVTVPEVSDGRYFTVAEALPIMIFGQREFVKNLVDILEKQSKL
jgi:predicted NUDIX family NTP pyrophosphohydrolase